jgi:subtilisin family serine protease
MTAVRPAPALTLALLLLSSASLAHADERRPYIVQLADQPVAAYTGQVSGLRATRAAAGQRLDLAGEPARQYGSFLKSRQQAARALLAPGAVTRDYQVVFNGFSARLTDAEVRALKASGTVRAITPDEKLHVVTNYTPTFLGLDQPGGLWQQLGGRARAGEDVIIGVLDTGIWPENLSYADRVDSQGQPTFDRNAKLAYSAPPARWRGTCQTGEGFTAANCNNKLIGARYFDDGFRAGGHPIHVSEFRSPRDSLSSPAGEGGHGTHTSSTAAGNDNVPALAASGDNLGRRSGMAPRARLAMYKICWTYNNGEIIGSGASNTCYNSDSLAAIEAAVTDGVDVINYSISGGASVLDPVEQAFRHAAEAGVFVAAAAGNSGPANEVAHISPWLTTVAASSHDRAHTATVKLGNGQVYSGTSLSSRALPATAVIRGDQAVATGAWPVQAGQCYKVGDNPSLQPSLDAAKVKGKIVVCQRGGNGRLSKAEAVRAAGGVGMILLDDGNGLATDVYALPTIHVTQEDGVAIDEYAAMAGATAALSAAVLTPTPGPIMADFSSRGPNRFDPGVLKPDLTAPGVDIIAGVAPSLTPAQHDAIAAGRSAPFSVSAKMSGTSMATPHVAGLAALLRQRHPDWSPAAIKSALMTSTYSVLPNTLTGDQDGTLPWGQGAGHVQPNHAADPGLVYDATGADYQRYQCGVTGAPADCSSGSLPGYALNLASITLPGVVGIQSVTRSVTNVGTRLASYTATAAVAGFTTTVTPDTLTIAPGETQRYTVTLRRTDAVDGVWNFGEVVWNDGEHTVRSPLQARYNSGVQAPPLLAATTASGTRQLAVTTGFDGRMGVAKAGMREYVRLAQTVTQAASGSLESTDAVAAACAARGPGVKAVTLAIPNNTMIARFELTDRDTAGGSADDLDLALLSQQDTLIGYSGHEGSNESITLMAPPMGVVKVCVVGYRLKNGASTSYTLSYATAIPNDTKGKLIFGLPATVQLGGTANVNVGWSGLEQGKRYLGGMQLLNPAGRPSSFTELDIDTRDVTPAQSAGARARFNAGQ